MIRSLRAFFLSRLLREKLLLVAFAGIGVVIWSSGFSSRASAFWRVKKTTTQELLMQERMLNDKSRVETAVQKAAAQLEPSKTLDANRLYAVVRQLGNEAGLKNFNQQGSPTDITTAQGSVHTLRFQVSNADWEALKKFYLALQERSPYIGIDQFILTGRANPPQHALNLTVSSFEPAR